MQADGTTAAREKKFRGDIEGPGRAREVRPKPQGASTSTPSAATPSTLYKMGDPELRLDVSKLNAYAAMQAPCRPLPPPPASGAPPDVRGTRCLAGDDEGDGV